VYEAELRSAILRILARWERLPESDVLRRLTPVQLAHLREELFEALADEGLIEMRLVGDERVLTITARGRQAAEGSGPL
jgi:hypothetical protein